jgi:CheY-like chemotaxis protein
MKTNGNPATILMAEDDPDDRLLTQEALREAELNNDILFVENGEELLNYLRRSGNFSDKSKFPKPRLILLDLNMPKMDGREALEEIKADPKLRSIPIIVLTTSKAEEDIIKTYNLGISGYITKPVAFDELIEVMKVIGKYWFEIVELPPNGNDNGNGKGH